MIDKGGTTGEGGCVFAPRTLHGRQWATPPHLSGCPFVFVLSIGLQSWIGQTADGGTDERTEREGGHILLVEYYADR